MTQDFVIAIDQGTTGTTLMAVGADGCILAKESQEFPQHFPQPGWVEHQPEEIWHSVLSVLAKLGKHPACDLKRCVGIGITNQRETAVVWERSSGQAPRRAIVWQDRRTAARCAELRAQGVGEDVRAKTGLVLDPYFSGTKFAWMLDEIDPDRTKVRQGELLLGTVDAYLLFQLTGGAVHATDLSNASRTLLCDIHQHRWSDELCKLFRVPQNALPEVRSSSEIYGKSRSVPGLPDGIPIGGMAGDQHAALFGQRCVNPGDAKCTYGTGAFLLANTGNAPVMSKHGLLTTPAWMIDGQVTYALEGSAFIAGAAVQWLRDGLGIIAEAKDIEALARQENESGGVTFVPALAGLGAPYWDPDARGMFCGLTRGSNRSHLAYAVLEGVAHQIVDLAECMVRDTDTDFRSLRVDGGATANDLLMEIQADLSGYRVERPRVRETTAMGAALLAGLATGFFPSLSTLDHSLEMDRAFEPTLAVAGRDARRAAWNAAVSRARSGS